MEGYLDHFDSMEYYVARAYASRDLAKMATRPAIAAIHLELANRYDSAVRQLQRQLDASHPVIRLVCASVDEDNSRRNPQFSRA
jgi:hypothetical protein